MICRACTKPNSVHVEFCTGCSFPAKKEDIARLPDNIFLQMINGEDVGTTVRYRNDELLVFDDKFGVSEHHLDVIPIKVYDNITVLDGSHADMLDRLVAAGKAELTRRNIPWLKGLSMDDFLSVGYNYPVSVKHLHVHVILAPFKHNKILQYPRWHSHDKVVGDLRKHGRVILYSDVVDDAAGAAVYARAMAAQDRANKLIAAAASDGANAKAEGASAAAK